MQIVAFFAVLASMREDAAMLRQPLGGQALAAGVMVWLGTALIGHGYFWIAGLFARARCRRFRG
jgi:hypothetical protein